MRKNVGGRSKVPLDLPRKFDIAYCVKFATTIQLVALMFTISLLSSVLTQALNTIVVVHGRDNL